VGAAYLSNASGTIAGSALQVLVVTAPPDDTGAFVGTVSAEPYAPVPRE
jgi:hypothetical protein